MSRDINTKLDPLHSTKPEDSSKGTHTPSLCWMFTYFQYLGKFYGELQPQLQAARKV